MAIEYNGLSIEDLDSMRALAQYLQRSRHGRVVLFENQESALDSGVFHEKKLGYCVNADTVPRDHPRFDPRYPYFIVVSDKHRRGAANA